MENVKPADQVGTQKNIPPSVPEQVKPADKVGERLNTPAPEEEPEEE